MGSGGFGAPALAPGAYRLAKSTSRSASKERDRRHSGPAGRSRLAHASGPRAQEGKEAAADEGLQAASPWDGEAPAAAAPAGAKPVEGGAKPSSHGRGGVQPAQRYSVRQLAKMEEKPIVLHKGTPLPGALPPPTGEKRWAWRFELLMAVRAAAPAAKQLSRGHPRSLLCCSPAAHATCTCTLPRPSPLSPGDLHLTSPPPLHLTPPHAGAGPSLASPSQPWSA